MTVGTLSVVGSPTNRKIQVGFINTKGQFVQKTLFEKNAFQIAEEQISLVLVEKIKADLNTVKNLKVEFEEEGDQLRKIREQGQSWDRGSASFSQNATGNTAETPKAVNPNNFHNPYNFVPALPRDQVTGELGDSKPVGHGMYHLDRYSGRIAVKLTTVTPLLIPDASLEEEDNNNHKTYPIRVGKDGKPYLPPTSIKGMLRSAYEAITNSRLSVIEDHGSCLAYRMPATIGLQMVPARIENNQIYLYPGTSNIGSDGKPQGAMYAAWLSRYDRNSTKLQHEVRYVSGALPEHKDHVEFWAEKFAKVNHQGNKVFTYWRVRKIVKQGQSLGAAPNPSRGNGNHQPTGEAMKQFNGYVYITNKNINNKHDERVFITNHSIKIPLDPNLKQKWTELITNYQEIHEDEINKKKMQGPPALTHSLWSRQVIASKAERELKNGTLCYAHVSKQGSNYIVKNLYPVMITRGLYEMSPGELLEANLKPATKKEQLSPADRVFGWVNQEGNGSYKGHLRVHSVTCMSDDPIDDFGSSQATVPLAILGQPKPQQFRFYSAQNRNGQALKDGSQQKNGYANNNQGLRGRKVYPHHKGLPLQYWQNPTQDRTQQVMNGHYQEYRRPKKEGKEQLDDQNRSIKGWVKPGVEFIFDIDVTNLSTVELGALLWLLSLPNLHFHRLGGAKPLGCGSVRLDIDWEQTDLRKGEDWKEFYKSLIPYEKPQFDAEACIFTYQEEVRNAYSSPQFEQVRFIKAFCRGAKGFDDNAAIHYPRITPNPMPEGEAFKWFVNNEQDTRQELGLKLTLPDLSEPKPKSFPIHPKRPKPSGH